MRNNKKSIVAEICLYGTQEIGAGWLATTADGKMLGTGEPVSGRSMTEAAWLAADAVRNAGHGWRPGIVRIFAAGGERMADCSI